VKKWVRKVGGREQRKENANKGMVKKWVRKVEESGQGIE
jgi:hypothetical protein